MRYFCEHVGSRFFAILDNDEGGSDVRECATKFDAMTMRDKAQAAGASSFTEVDGLTLPMPALSDAEIEQLRLRHQPVEELRPAAVEPELSAAAEAHIDEVVTDPETDKALADGIAAALAAGPEAPAAT